MPTYTQVLTSSTGEYPFPQVTDLTSNTVTIGDIESNCLKLLHILIKHGVVILESEEDYHEFSLIYAAFSEFSEFYVKKRKEINELVTHFNNGVKSLPMSSEDVFANKNAVTAGSSVDNGFLCENQKEKLLLLMVHVDNISNQKGTIKESALLLSHSLLKLETILSKLKVIDHPPIIIRLLGYEFSGRAGNDYLTLRLLQRLKKNSNVDLRIIYSIYNQALLTAFENYQEDGKATFTYVSQLNEDQSRSLMGLKGLIDEDILKKEELFGLAETLKSSIKLIDYSLSDNTLSLFTHAPVFFEMVHTLANEFEVVYNDTTKEDLAETIDKINTQFRQKILKNQVRTYADNKVRYTFNMSDEDIQKYPLTHLVGNRNNTGKNNNLKGRPYTLNDYHLIYFYSEDNKLVPRSSSVSNLHSRKSQDERMETSVIISNDTVLNYQHDPELIKQEFIQHQSSISPGNRKILFSSLLGLSGMIVGLGIGAALFFTGVLAPLGLALIATILIIVSASVFIGLFTGITGYFIAKSTESIPINTRINESLERVTSEDNLILTEDETSKISDAFYPSPFTVDKIISESNSQSAFKDWNRLNTGSVIIDETPINQLVQKDRKLTAPPVGELFDSTDDLGQFFRDHILNKINDKSKIIEIIDFLHRTFHQASLLNPITSNIFLQLQNVSENKFNIQTAQLNDTIPSQVRDIEIKTTHSGFILTEKLTQRRCRFFPGVTNFEHQLIPEDASEKETIITPDQGKEYVFKNETTISVDFSEFLSGNRAEVNPDIKVEKNVIHYGNKHVEKFINTRINEQIQFKDTNAIDATRKSPLNTLGIFSVDNQFDQPNDRSESFPENKF